MYKLILILYGVSVKVNTFIPLTNNELHLSMLNGCSGDDCDLLRNIKQHPFFISNAYGPEKDTDDGFGKLQLQIFSPSQWPFTLHSDKKNLCSSRIDIGHSGASSDAPDDGTGYCLGLSSLSISFASLVANNTTKFQFGNINGSGVFKRGRPMVIIRYLKSNPTDWLSPEEWAAEIKELVREGGTPSYLNDIEFALNQNFSWVEKEEEDTFHLSFKDIYGESHIVRLTKNIFSKNHNGKHKKHERQKNPFDAGPVGEFIDDQLNTSYLKYYVSGHSIKELIFSYGLVVLAYAHRDSPLYDRKAATLAIKEFDIICQANPGSNEDPNLVLKKKLLPSILGLWSTVENEIFKVTQKDDTY